MGQHTWDLTPFVGHQVTFPFRYTPDGGLHYEGPVPRRPGDHRRRDHRHRRRRGRRQRVDRQRLHPDERLDDEVVQYDYLDEDRTYKGFDANLKTGPYNVGFVSTEPKWVERFLYQKRLLTWYIDNEFTDHNTISHPGGGVALPVDARPAPVVFPDGATFGQEDTTAVTFHRNGVPAKVASSDGIPWFDDSVVTATGPRPIRSAR